MTRTAGQMLADAVALVPAIDPRDALDAFERGEAVLLDVREPVEWEQYAVGAVQVPRGVLEFQADPESPRHNAAIDPGKKICVYCRSGARAALAAATLMEMGFPDVANITGGFAAWRDAELPVAEAHAGL